MMEVIPISVNVWTMRILASMFSPMLTTATSTFWVLTAFQGAFIRRVALNRKGRTITDGLNFRLFPIDGEDFTPLLNQRFRDAIAESAQADHRELTLHGCLPLI